MGEYSLEWHLIIQKDNQDLSADSVSISPLNSADSVEL